VQLSPPSNADLAVHRGVNNGSMKKTILVAEIPLLAKASSDIPTRGGCAAADAAPREEHNENTHECFILI